MILNELCVNWAGIVTIPGKALRTGLGPRPVRRRRLPGRPVCGGGDGCLAKGLGGAGRGRAQRLAPFLPARCRGIMTESTRILDGPTDPSVGFEGQEVGSQ